MADLKMSVDMAVFCQDDQEAMRWPTEMILHKRMACNTLLNLCLRGASDEADVGLNGLENDLVEPVVEGNHGEDGAHDGVIADDLSPGISKSLNIDTLRVCRYDATCLSQSVCSRRLQLTDKNTLLRRRTRQD